MSAITNGEIRGGIEFFKDRDAEQCARCGSSVAWVRCWQCGGEGSLGSACIDDLCHGEEECIHGDDELIPCDICRGTGAFPHCISSPEWCRAHPMPGREEVKSTALEPAAWRDVDG